MNIYIIFDINDTEVTDPNDHDKTMCKFLTIRDHIQFYKYDIFGISDTWLDESRQNDDLLIPSYCKPIRRDVSRHHCGIMVYASKHLPAKRRYDIEPVDTEIICVEVQAGNGKILVCNCSRAPRHDVVDFFASTSDIITINGNEFDHIVFLGDMNGRNSLFWNQDIANTEGRALLASFIQHEFDHFIHEPTRIVENCVSCINLMFTKNPFVFRTVGTHDKIVDICDDCPIYANLNYTYKKPECYKRWVWNFKNGDLEKYQKFDS